jgi:hypothetical protein
MSLIQQLLSWTPGFEVPILMELPPWTRWLPHSFFSSPTLCTLHYTRPFSHFTRCIATAMLKVTSLESQGYTCDCSLPRFRLQAVGGWVIVFTYVLHKDWIVSHCLESFFTIHFIFQSIYINRHLVIIRNHLMTLPEFTLMLCPVNDLFIFYGPRRLTPEMFQ